MTVLLSSAQQVPHRSFIKLSFIIFASRQKLKEEGKLKEQTSPLIVISMVLRIQPGT